MQPLFEVNGLAITSTGNNISTSTSLATGTTAYRMCHNAPLWLVCGPFVAVFISSVVCAYLSVRT